MWFGKEDSTQAHWRQDKIQNTKVFSETASSTQENSEYGKTIQDGTVRGKKPKNKQRKCTGGGDGWGSDLQDLQNLELELFRHCVWKKCWKAFYSKFKEKRQRTKGDRAQTIHWMISTFIHHWQENEPVMNLKKSNIK